MFNISKSKNDAPKVETMMDKIHKTSLDLLFQEFYRDYKWNMEETKAVLSKCIEFPDYVYLYYHARGVGWMGEVKTASREIIDLIYLQLCIAFNKFLRELPEKDEIDQVKLIIKLYCSPETRMRHGWVGNLEIFRKRLEALWLDLTDKLFEALKLNSAATAKDYEQLFFLCQNDDPKILIIAGEINKLS